MSDTTDPAALPQAFCAEWLKQNQGCELIDHGFGSEHGGELTTDLILAAVAELKLLRTDHQILLDGNQRLQTMNNGLRQMAIEAREAADGWHRATIDLYSGRVEQPPGIADYVFDGLQSLINDMRDRPSPFKEFEARQAAERETARAADVPDELIQAAADVLEQTGLWGAWERQQTEDEVRDILTTVLPLHTQPAAERDADHGVEWAVQEQASPALIRRTIFQSEEKARAEQAANGGTLYHRTWCTRSHDWQRIEQLADEPEENGGTP